MPRIALLSEQVASQVAAGEVVERPASVVKELVENSIDAGARKIEVLIRRGGISSIRVTDDGCGMDRDDALLCLERHATSKIRTGDDLAAIHTLGFRGEALPSIASVSRFRLATREHGALAGTEVLVQGGKIESVKDCGEAPGTQIEVRSLFYNLPARRKFLRTEPPESAHIRHTLLLAGLARPEVGFTLAMDEQPAQRWMPGEDLRQRLISVFGAEWVELIVPIEAASGGLRLRGFIGKPGVSRAARTEELFFINQRPVENRTLHFGLLEGYHNSLMKGRYPVAILFLEMDPSGVDVNIHPAKREVRFHDDFTIRHFVVKSIQEALGKFSGAPATKFTFDGPPSTPAPATDAPDKSYPSHESYKSHPPQEKPASETEAHTQSPSLNPEQEAQPLALQPTLPLPEETLPRHAAPR